MEKEIILKPKKGLIVRDPDTKNPLSKNGEKKSLNKYWKRRLKEKSVEIISEINKLKIISDLDQIKDESQQKIIGGKK